mmetsp:Transcript_9021/g.9067  ORF Transcript_9021/g.9067 Transcript_9021/m.9067 type:complete len:660 (+) Transcript_9021:195-2174(+)
MENPDFELGTDYRSEARLIQDLAWSNSVSDGRQQLSNREAYIMHGRELKSSIVHYHITCMLCKALHIAGNSFFVLQPEVLRRIVDFAFPGQGSLVSALTNLPHYHSQLSIINSGKIPFRICARKRPLMQFEKDIGAYDVIHIISPSNECVLHDGRLGRHGRLLTMTHHRYCVDRVWNEYVNNHTVCDDEVKPLLAAVTHGKDATLICYGQTGTGKTYTLMGAIEYLSHNIIGQSIKICFYEIHDKRCYDLLNNRNIVYLRSDAQENVHIRGIKYIKLENMKANELITILQDALQLRSSEVTERNPISSRSHAICSIEFLSYTHSSMIDMEGKTDNLSDLNNDRDLLNNNTINNIENKPSDMISSLLSLEKTERERRPVLTLVDLAGSERNYETTKMTAEQHKESAQINLSLMALKHCFSTFHHQVLLRQSPCSEKITPKIYNERIDSDRQPVPPSTSTPSFSGTSPRTRSKTKSWSSIAANTRISYRQSPLTRVLRPCFTNGIHHKTTIIATLSPSPIDLLHSVNTLYHVVMMSPTLQLFTESISLEVPISGSPMSHIPVSSWTAKEVQAWLGTVNGGRFSHLVLPQGLDGRGLLGLNDTSLAALCAGELRQARQEDEGSAWVVEGEANERHSMIGQALWRAIHREEKQALLLSKNFVH